ncbi:hypothetical protein DPMN_073159 [Dreissena polymorpha]|uniref:Uncharacterized protein n=1 Tax=Dreissena polymorpha TaxID=45954 RepID=A0A9D4HAJ1_DREPO|nr:hypothetical protein DPMN_073159 [Dreissena polymorpha]
MWAEKKVCANFESGSSDKSLTLGRALFLHRKRRYDSFAEKRERSVVPNQRQIERDNVSMSLYGDDGYWTSNYIHVRIGHTQAFEAAAAEVNVQQEQDVDGSQSDGSDGDVEPDV